jgi:hypothetical protein
MDSGAYSAACSLQVLGCNFIVGTEMRDWEFLDRDSKTGDFWARSPAQNKKQLCFLTFPIDTLFGPVS